MDAQVQKEKRRGSHRMRILCSQLHSTTDVWPFITWLQSIPTWGHICPDSLLTNLSATLFVCVSVFANGFVCAEEGLCLKGMQVQWKKSLSSSTCLTHTHMHTYVLDLEKEGCGEVRRGKAICKSICCVKINFLLRDFESHNSLAFPGQFPSDTCS